MLKKGQQVKCQYRISFDFNYRPNLRSKHIQISSNKYYITFPHSSNSGSVEKSNFYSFNIDNLTFQPLPNSEIVNQRGNPHRFIESSNFHNFVARSSSDFSYQLFSIQKEEITSTIEKITPKSDLKITPNPSSNFISIGIDAEFLRISNPNGRYLKTLLNYKQNEQIDISELRRGVYFLEVENSKIKQSCSFVKI